MRGPRKPAGWRRLLAVALALAALSALVACGPEQEGDPQLTVYLSAPLSGPRAADGQDVADGAALALADAGGEAGDTAVVLETLDGATAEGWDSATAGDNARIATQDATTIAFIGDLDSGASRTSVPITNEAGVLQISPGSGAEDLTRDSLGTSDIPLIQATGERTFGRVIPSDRAQGEAAGVLMAESGISEVAVVDDGSTFSEALLAGLESAPAGPDVVDGQADATVVAAQDPPVSDVLSGLFFEEAPLFLTDAQFDYPVLGKPAVLSFNRSIQLTSAALDPTQLPPAADPFLAAFEDAYDREPGRYAAYGYEAMAVALDSIDRAEDPLVRSDVVDAFFATTERQSILGVYSIDGVGDTTLSTLGAYELSGGEPALRPAAGPITLP